MTTDLSIEELLERVEALAVAERNALIRFDAQALADLIPEKETLTQHLAAARKELPQEKLDLLRAKFARNGDLIDAAQRGLKSAVIRMEETLRAAEHFDTYDADGKRREERAKPGVLERRA